MTQPAAPADSTAAPGGQPAAETDPGTTTAPAEDTPAGQEPTPNSEAARYRVKLREAESERDNLASRLTAMQRRECENSVADMLDVPADLFELGRADPASFYDDNGAINQDELRAAVEALIQQRPRLARQDRNNGKQWGQAGAIAPASGTASWDDVIKG